MLTRAGELAATTQLSDFDRHTIYYSRKTLMIHFCLYPFFPTSSRRRVVNEKRTKLNLVYEVKQQKRIKEFQDIFFSKRT